MNAIKLAIAAGLLYGILAVVISLYIFALLPTKLPVEGPWQIHVFIGAIMTLAEIVYTSGFVIAGRRCQSNFLIWSSLFLISALLVELPLWYVIVLNPDFGSQSFPWFYYIWNDWEELAVAAFGISLIVLGPRIGWMAVLAGVATLLLSVCYAITATPVLVTELVLLAATGFGVATLADVLKTS